jgi:hypothetical protein
MTTTTELRTIPGCRTCAGGENLIPRNGGGYTCRDCFLREIPLTFHRVKTGEWAGSYRVRTIAGNPVGIVTKWGPNWYVSTETGDFIGTAKTRRDAGNVSWMFHARHGLIGDPETTR